MKNKHVRIWFLFIAIFLTPCYSNAENLNEKLNLIINDIEQKIVASEYITPAFIVVRSFMDKSSMQPNELSQKTENSLLKIILDRYLGQRKTLVLNWQCKTPLVATASSEAGVVQYRQGLMGKTISEQFGDGFLISGTTDLDAGIIRIDVELIDMGTGNVLTRSTESIKLKESALKLSGALPPPSAPPPSKKLKKTSTIRLDPIKETKDLQYQVKSGKDFRFEGQMKDGLMHGQGTYFYNSGDKYQGQWEKDKMHGHGAYIFADGEKYVGQWENGKMSGQGSYFYKNGDKFVGEWKNRKKNGPGTYYFSNGDTWEGVFLDNKKHGPAKYTWANGQSKKEYWENGKLIQH